MSSGEISRADLSDEDIAQLKKYEQLESENRDIPLMPETPLQAHLVTLGLLSRETLEVANPSPEIKEVVRRHRITEKGKAVLRS